MPTRYPNALPDSIPARVYTKEAAGEAVMLSEEIIEFVKEKISKLESLND